MIADQITKALRELLLRLRNGKPEREILNRWKQLGLVDENYCGPLHEVAFWVEWKVKEAFFERDMHQKYPELFKISDENQKILKALCSWCA
jgi:hypothetical protein